MSSIVTLARTALYGVFTLWAFLTFVLSAALIAKTESFDTGYFSFSFYYKASAELLAASILALLVVPPLHFIFHRREANSVVSALWVELVVVGVFFLLFLGGAAAMADSFINVSNCHDTVCSLYSATEAFAWLSWITLVFLAGLLIFVVITESRKGRKSVLTDRFALSQSRPIAKSESIDPAPVPMSQTKAEV